MTERTAVEPEPGIFASSSLSRHLGRGAFGFGMLGAAFLLIGVLGPLALLFAPAGLVVLRGCPACWTVGLFETISAGRLQRSCDQRGCAVGRPAAELRGVRR